MTSRYPKSVYVIINLEGIVNIDQYAEYFYYLDYGRNLFRNLIVNNQFLSHLSRNPLILRAIAVLLRSFCDCKYKPDHDFTMNKILHHLYGR